MLSVTGAKFLVMDGGMGTSIEDHGIDVANPLWGSHALLSEDGRKANDAIHRGFVEAGAELLIANTHNASLASCEDYVERRGYGGTPLELFHFVNAQAIDSARRAGGALVAGCVGSADRPYATRASVSVEDADRVLTTHASKLASLPIDLLLFEMISTPNELEGVARACEVLPPELAIGVGFTCGEAGTTHGGVSMREAVVALPRARWYFVQCTRYDLVERPLLELIEAAGDARKTGVYANDGRRWVDQKWAGERVSPQVYAKHAERWARLGVSVIGGCCGTRPEHIAALARLRSSL